MLNCNRRELYCKFVWYETSNFIFFLGLELGRVTVLSTRCSLKPSVLILEADLGETCCKTSLRARVSKERVFSSSSSCCLQNTSTAPICNYLTGMWSTWGMWGRLLQRRRRVSGSPGAKEKKLSILVSSYNGAGTRLNQGFKLCAQPKAVHHALSMTSFPLDLSYPLISNSFLMPAEPGLSSWEEEQQQHHFHYCF